MDAHNIEEYHFVSKVIGSTIEDVSRYTTFVLTASGAFIAASAGFFATFYNRGDPGKIDVIFPVMAVAFLGLSIITLMMLYVINYKCDSHNRLVGYRTMISSERLIDGASLDLKKDDPLALFSYDHSINMLRRLNGGFETINDSYIELLEPQPGRYLFRRAAEDGLSKEKLLLSFLIRIGPKARLHETVKQYEADRHRQHLDQWKFLKALRLYFDTALFRVRTESWIFPIYLNLPIMFIVVAEYSAAVAFLYFSSLANIIIWAIFAFISLYIGSLIYRVSSLYYQIITGSRTITSYYWIFVVLRAKFIQIEHGGKIKTDYIGRHGFPKVLDR